MVVFVSIGIQYKAKPACWIVGAIVLVISIVTAVVIREPKIKKVKTERNVVEAATAEHSIQEPLLANP